MAVRRIKIDLSKIFSDYRKCAYITIDSKWNSIDDLQHHILDLFGIKSKIYLTTDDGILIPAKETIDIISLDDSIITHLMEFHESSIPAQTQLNVSQSSNEEMEIKQKRKRKRKRKLKQVITEVNEEIAEENGYDDEHEIIIGNRVAKLLKWRDSSKEEIEVIAEPVIKVIPKLNIISSLPKIVYGF